MSYKGDFAAEARALFGLNRNEAADLRGLMEAIGFIPGDSLYDPAFAGDAADFLEAVLPELEEEEPEEAREEPERQKTYRLDPAYPGDEWIEPDDESDSEVEY